MPLSRATLFGATVRSITASLGWGANQTSQLQVNLVEDPTNGDLFVAPTIGTPGTFTYGSFTFRGITQKYERQADFNGLPVYSAIITDPREVLDNVQVIYGNYNGAVNQVRNVVNAFGYWENALGFGGSLANDNGMPWVMITGAIYNIVNQPTITSYGGPLLHRGYAYGIDLSEVPTPPANYSMQGTLGSILSLVATVCEDMGFDFFVDFVPGNTHIKVRTQSRLTQPPLGTIATITGTNTGHVIRSNYGQESRNETTQSFLIGGDVTTLYRGSNISSFWGFDINGNPLLGTLDFVDLSGIDGTQRIWVERMSLNSSPVADLLGTTDYSTNTLELRTTLQSQQTWENYLFSQKPTIASGLGLNPEFRNLIGSGAIAPPDIVNDLSARATYATNAALTSQVTLNSNRMFDFLKSYAINYMGKKWAVTTPTVSYRYNNENGAIIYSYEPTDAGWVDDVTTLPLQDYNTDFFQTTDRRYQAFSSISSSGADLSRLNIQDSVLQNNVLYPSSIYDIFTRCTIDPQIIFPVSGTTAVVATLSSVIYEKAIDVRGGMGLVANLLGMSSGYFVNAIGAGAFGSMPHYVSPNFVKPDFIFVPLKSNILTYGPWYASGAVGKVRVDQDNSLVPWNYGGYTLMNAAALARVAANITNMTISENGSLEIDGAPTASLGDTLAAGSPNITNMDLRIGPDGVTTTYRFQTYTPRFGTVSKKLSENITKIAQNQQYIRKIARGTAKDILGRQLALQDAYRGWLANATETQLRQSPSPILVGYCFQGSGYVRTGISAATNQEAVSLANAHNDKLYQNSTIESFAGVFHPVKSNNTTTPSGLMTQYLYGSSGISSAVLIKGASYHPWDVTGINKIDIDYLTTGTGFNRLNTVALPSLSGNVEKRFFGLRMPIVAAGWGYDIDGNNIANYYNYQANPSGWKAGPVDLVWHPYRGVWTSHDIVKGKLQGTLAISGVATMGVFQDGSHGAGFNLTVNNFFSSSIASGTNVMAGFTPEDAKWWIMAADC